MSGGGTGVGSLYLEALQLNANRLLGDSPGYIVNKIDAPDQFEVAANFEVNRLGY